MTITHLTVLQFYIIALIDSDRHIGVDPHEVKTTINKGDLFVWLDTRFPNQVDTSLYVDSQAQVGEEVLTTIRVALDGHEHRNTGVQHNGLCLLAALINQAIQTEARRPQGQV